VLLAKKQSVPILNALSLTRPALAGLELKTSRLLSESTATRLRQPVFLVAQEVDILLETFIVYNPVMVLRIHVRASLYMRLID
jgi:hypothetical protein